MEVELQAFLIAALGIGVQHYSPIA